MSTRDFSGLDEAIVRLIGEGETERFYIVAKLRAKHIGLLTAALDDKVRDSEVMHALVERRLQALRRTGRIAYQRKAWRLA